MTEVSFNPSTKGPSQGHQAMGSAGSFWLPPKMRAETFNSNLQKFSTSSNKFPGKVSEKGNNILSRAGVSNNSPKDNITKPRSVPNHVGSESSVKASKLGNLSFHSTRANTLKGQSLLSNPSMPSKVIPPPYAHSNPTSFNSPQSKTSGSVSQQISTLSGQNVATRFSKIDDLGFGGTKSATSYSNLDDSKYHKKPKNSFNDNELTHSNPLSHDELLDRVEDSFVSGGIGFSHNNGILRFAFSLDNGSSVSVRIEKAANDFKICFISNNQETRDFLATKLLSFSNNLPIPSEHSLNTHIFSSYKEMDHAFSNKQNLP
jgi:hypothetical protein